MGERDSLRGQLRQAAEECAALADADERAGEREPAPEFRCGNCGYPYDPTATRWMCPECRWKDTCCEGAPQ